MTAAAPPVGAPAAARDATVIALVGGAHFCSHFFQLAMPPLFPLMRDEFGVSYVELGLIMSVFFGVSGVSQALVGIAVDRYGARPILLAGLSLLAGATTLAAFAPAYWVLLPIAALCGLGNSVFHPADMSILSLKVSPPRMGRAFSIHQFGGTMGYTFAPAVTGGLGLLFGWRAALLIAGVVGLCMVLALVRAGDLIATPPGAPRPSRGGAGAGDAKPAAAAPVRYAALIASPAIMMAFGYFLLVSAGGSGVQTFSIPALTKVFGLELGIATAALTGYLLASAAGILAGGFLADRVPRHDIVAMAGMGVGAGLMVVVASGAAPGLWAAALLMLAGAAAGVTAPSRDLLIRAATPKGATGKAFGFVYSGLDAGSTLSPLIFGLIVDQGAPQAVFAGVAVLWSLTIATVISVRRGRVER
jgi:FSR family fosmidomycin resistance protein-like MFS transporter